MWWPFSGRSDLAVALAASALWLAAAGPAQPWDYPRIFGDSYREAGEFVARNAAASRVFESFGIPAGEAWAIVFPELLRWSALADLIQTSNLQSLYVQMGPGYSDFSVGRFQMKPSFVETLEGDFNRLIAPAEQKRIRGGPFALEDTVENRRARVRRLTELDDQVLYLVIFFRVMDRLYVAETFASSEEKVRFYAAAYNSGYRAGAARIRRETARSRFHMSVLPSRPFYNYADISADFLRRSPAIFPPSVR